MGHSHVVSVWNREYTNCIFQRLYRPICARPARLLPIPLAERELREGRSGPCKSSISLRKFLQQLPLCACHATNVMGTRGGSKGGRGGRAPSPQKFQPCFFAAWHACSARLTFDQRTVLCTERSACIALRVKSSARGTRYA